MCYSKLIKKVAPTPKIEKYDKFLFVAAHADDIPKAAGGTVKKLIGSGKEVKFLITTDSCLSIEQSENITERAELRKKEALLSAAILGVKEVEFLPFSECDKIEFEEITNEIAKVIDAFRPDVVFVDDYTTPNELLFADEITSKATVRAIELLKNVTTAEKLNCNTLRIKALSFYNSVRNNAYICVNGCLEMKLQAVMAQNSLLPKKDLDKFGYMRAYKSLIRLTALRNGLRSFKFYAEGFYVVGGKATHNMPEINL